jgi:hypothetical protein
LLAENYLFFKTCCPAGNLHTILQNLLVTTFERVWTRFKPVLKNTESIMLKKIIILPGLTRVDILGGVRVQLFTPPQVNIHVDEGGG